MRHRRRRRSCLEKSELLFVATTPLHLWLLFHGLLRPTCHKNAARILFDVRKELKVTAQVQSSNIEGVHSCRDPRHRCHCFLTNQTKWRSLLTCWSHVAKVVPDCSSRLQSLNFWKDQKVQHWSWKHSPSCTEACGEFWVWDEPTPADSQPETSLTKTVLATYSSER